MAPRVAVLRTMTGRGGEKEVRKKRSIKGKDEKKKEMTVAA